MMEEEMMQCEDAIFQEIEEKYQTKKVKLNKNSKK